MNGTVLDRLARSLATGGHSRRTTLRALIGGLGAAIALEGDDAGAATCRRRLRPCKRSSQCCGKNARCGTSHGAGTGTCCGALGATCRSDLDCCTRWYCHADGRCGVGDT